MDSNLIQCIYLFFMNSFLLFNNSQHLLNILPFFIIQGFFCWRRSCWLPHSWGYGGLVCFNDAPLRDASVLERFVLLAVAISISIAESIELIFYLNSIDFQFILNDWSFSFIFISVFFGCIVDNKSILVYIWRVWALQIAYSFGLVLE